MFTGSLYGTNCVIGNLAEDLVAGWRGKSKDFKLKLSLNPWLIHVNVWQKPLQYCKVTNLQLIKINEKKKKKP